MCTPLFTTVFSSPTLSSRGRQTTKQEDLRTDGYGGGGGAPQSAEGIQLDGALLNYKQAGVARPLHECMPGLSSKGWFDLMTNRLDNFVVTA